MKQNLECRGVTHIVTPQFLIPHFSFLIKFKSAQGLCASRKRVLSLISVPLCLEDFALGEEEDGGEHGPHHIGDGAGTPDARQPVEA
jgi:hypothetical protein